MSNTILTLFGEEFAPIPNQGGMKARVKKNTATQKETSTEKAEESNIPPAPEVETSTPIEETTTQEVKVAPAIEKKVVEKKTIVLDAISPDEQKQYQTIGEVAKLFDLNTSHIRFWTKEFNIKVFIKNNPCKYEERVWISQPFRFKSIRTSLNLLSR